jgi:DNA-binding transcriptional ArsR family regulator
MFEHIKLVRQLSPDETEDVLRGTTLKVYRFLLKSNKPVGVREVQRALNLSSPSLAAYHLSRLEEVGLLKREKSDYMVDKVFLKSMIRIRRFLIPRYLFYSVFAISAFIFELTLFWPTILTSGYVFSTIATFIFALAFCYETVKTWIEGGL